MKLKGVLIGPGRVLLDDGSELHFNPDNIICTGFDLPPGGEPMTFKIVPDPSESIADKRKERI